MAQGDTVNDIITGVSSDAIVTAQPASGENWTIKMAAQSDTAKFDMLNTLLHVGLDDGTTRRGVAGPSDNNNTPVVGGVRGGGTGGGSLESIQVDNSIFFYMHNDSNGTQSEMYSGIQHK